MCFSSFFLCFDDLKSNNHFSNNISSKKNNFYGDYLSWSYATKKDNLQDTLFFLKKIRNSIHNIGFHRKALFVALMADDWELSKDISKKILKYDSKDLFSNILLTTESFLNEDYSDANNFLKSIEKFPIDSYFFDIIQNYIHLAENKNVLKNKLNLNTDDCIPLECLHFGLMNKINNNSLASQYFLLIDKEKFQSFRISEILINFYLKEKKYYKSKEIYQFLIKNDFPIIEFQKLKEKKDFFNEVKEVSHGLAEVYFNIAGWFYEQDLYQYSIFFAKLGLNVRPNFSALRYLLGNIYEKLSMNEDAIKILNLIDEDDLYFLKSSKLKLKVYNETKNFDQNEILLSTLINKFPKNIEFKVFYANFLRITDKFEESLEYYGQVINSISENDEKYWNLFYYRGIAFERLKKWEKAEKDFFTALELNPDAAFVLNYLAYSWLERGIKFEKSKKLLLKASVLEPNNPYILDSLGWAYYQLGNYSEAVKILEKALSVLPFDSTLNNHLGDAYWKLGRINEAISHWERALMFDPEIEIKDKIKNKIESGI